MWVLIALLYFGYRFIKEGKEIGDSQESAIGWTIYIGLGVLFLIGLCNS